MYDRFAEVYDLLYSTKDYAAECDRVWQTMTEVRGTPPTTLLDVACGTGLHMVHFAPRVTAIAGLDHSPGMLTRARQRLPQAPLHQGDFTDFALGQTFDAVVCLFSAIAYAVTYDRMAAAVRCMAKHLAPGGVLVVEPFLEPHLMVPGHVSLHTAQTEEMAVSRVAVSEVNERVYESDWHFLVARRDEGTVHYVERHRIGLFTFEDYRRAFEAAGLHAIDVDSYDLTGRGLCVGTATS